MLPTPKKFALVVGYGEGKSRLNAFDHALLDAGVGSLNLIKVSSILPPGAEYVDRLEIPPGSLTPTAYGAIISDSPGEVISAAIGVGFSENSFGMIMEFSGKCTREEADRAVRAMVEEAFASRGMSLREVKSKAIEAQVRGVACCFAAATLWY
ncbi:MAG: arginine decarboxylase, pyruvoyl-dependent [Bacillota bacterium]